MLTLIPYQKAYAQDVANLCHLAIQSISEAIYSADEKFAWSFAPRSPYHWHKRLSKSQAWLVVDSAKSISGKPVCCGVINVETRFDSQGYIDSLYVAPNYQKRGIAKQLYQALELWARQQKFAELTVDASKVSKPLFEAQGFKLRHRSYQEKRGVIIMGYYMNKPLS
ncbi:GNAT family N-acetyltransferase [Shewanella pneumatophori]|uniref:GNAT family N-acetyltransferase n=1 Tax=Shewanella pneumatophori TaxID=314092 RepID=A0A9X1ZGT6_9GAMM|nr:GNAT family N-acetyltransferase [Shewanella pneumatophori]MCL1139710.1 GNAT family N-acetyltransferase [Shewanella pneumatophori]